MILDHNITSKVAWNSSGNNTDGMNEVATALTNDTASWNTNLKARLISANEVAKITGNTIFSPSDASNNWFYLDNNSQTQSAKSQGASKYAWLFDYTNGCTNYGCNISDSNTRGYWTSTPITNDTQRAWLIYENGTLQYGKLIYNADYKYGLRPVITISKIIIG